MSFRDSGFVNPATILKRKEKSETYRRAFEQDRIFNGLQEANFMYSHLNGHPLEISIESQSKPWLLEIIAQPAGSRVVIVLRRIEGLCDLTNLEKLLYGQRLRQHQTTILIRRASHNGKGTRSLGLTTIGRFIKKAIRVDIGSVVS